MPDVWIIDDQPHLQELFSEEFRDEGYELTCIADADSARGHIQNSRPDLVLLDLYLDGFEGWDVLREIKGRYPRMPVLIVTAYDNYADDPRASQADGYVIKNFTALQELKQKMADLLGRRSSCSRAEGQGLGLFGDMGRTQRRR